MFFIGASWSGGSAKLAHATSVEFGQVDLQNHENNGDAPCFLTSRRPFSTFVRSDMALRRKMTRRLRPSLQLHIACLNAHCDQDGPSSF